MANEPMKRGRKSKKELAATKDMTKREQAAALREFRQKLLTNPKSEHFIEKLFATAFDDEHRQQSVAMKILADRLLPVAGFTADGKQQAQVQVNITGVNADDGSVVINGTTGEVEDE